MNVILNHSLKKITMISLVFLLASLTLTCSYPVDLCKSLECHGDFVCIEKSSEDTFSCRCSKGIPCRNNFLDNEPKPKSSSTCPCQNNGICSGMSLTTTSAPACQCQPHFTGTYCEQFSLGQTNTENNLCNVYTNANVKVCQNGGICVFVSSGIISCICPTSHTGQFCEQPVYLQCNTTSGLVLCHRDYGTCYDGICVCRQGYTGEKCDQRDFCVADYCKNNGICRTIDVPPYVTCVCQTGFYGKNCEIEQPLNLVPGVGK